MRTITADDGLPARVQDVAVQPPDLRGSSPAWSDGTLTRYEIERQG